MIEVNTHEAKTRLSELIRRAEEGEDVIVARHGRPVAKLIPWPPRRPPVRFGAWADLIDERQVDATIGSDADVLEVFDHSADGA